MLQSINELPISDTEPIEVLQEAVIADNILDSTKKSVLGNGLNYNSDDGVIFQTDTDGFINISSDVLFAIPTNGENYAVDGGRLFNKIGRASCRERV